LELFKKYRAAPHLAIAKTILLTAIIKVAIIVILLLYSMPGYTQDAETDSLMQVATKGKDDSVKVNALISLASANVETSLDKALEFANKAETLAIKINFLSGEAYAYKWLGIINYRKGNYYEALVKSNKSLSIFETLGDKVGTSNLLNNLGSFYAEKDEDSKAVEYYIRSLGTILGNIGVIYSKNTATSDTALNYYFKAIPYLLDVQDSEAIGIFYTNIGEVYAAKKDFPQANDYYNKAVNIFGISSNAAYAYNDLGKMYKQKQSYDSANIYFDKAYAIALQIDSPLDEMQSLIGKGQLQIVLGKMEEAVELFNKALRIGKQMQSSPELKEIYEGLSSAYTKMGDYKSAYLAQSSLNDLYNTVNERKLSFNTATLEYAMELQRQSAMLIKENKLQGMDLENEKFARNVSVSALGVLLIVTVILLININQRKKLNRLLSIQKRKIEAQKESVENALNELKAAQAQLIQSEKMASLGELTAGVAHEIQNPLNFVNNFSELSSELMDEMMEELNKADIEEAKAIATDIRQNLLKINHHGKRADAIVRGMLQHSRKNTGQKEWIDINALADECLRLSYHGLRAKDKAFNANFTTHFDKSIGKLNLIPQDINRVLLNLFNNAFYAVNEKKKQLNGTYEPVVTVNTKRLPNQVEIKINDNGIGIPQNIMPKVFQPFFTTKPTGQGTGLGLSLSYDIIKAHGGEIKLESKEGEGTEFIIQLPVSKSKQF